jgi:hypothetical protein
MSCRTNKTFYLWFYYHFLLLPVPGAHRPASSTVSSNQD